MPSPRPWQRYDMPTTEQRARTQAEQAAELRDALRALADEVSPHRDLIARQLLLQAAEDCAQAHAILRKAGTP